MVAVYPGSMSFLGIGKETEAGTPVVPERYIPYREFTPVDQAEILVDEGYRGSMVKEYGGAPGPRSAEIELSGVPFVDSIGDLLHNVLGDYAVTGTGPYVHAFSVLNSGQGQPPTHTLTHRQGITATSGARQYPFLRFGELSLSGDGEGLLEYEASAMGRASQAAAAAPVNAPPSSSVTPTWRSSVSIAGTASPAIRQWSVAMSREQVADYTASGSQDVWNIGDGEITVSGSLTVRASDVAPLAADQPIIDYLAGTVRAITITCAQLGGNAAHSLELALTECQFDSANLVQETLYGWEIGFKAYGNATDAGASGGASPIKATLTNALTTY